MILRRLLLEVAICKLSCVCGVPATGIVASVATFLLSQFVCIASHAHHSIYVVSIVSLRSTHLWH